MCDWFFMTLPRENPFDKRIVCMVSISMIDEKVLPPLPLNHLPLDALRTFVAASELGSFTQAGHQVHRTQSAVSMQMKRLEEELGRRLFERKARTVSLTPDGELLLGYAKRMLRLHDEALASLAAPEMTGQVRLGVPDDYATRYLPGVLSRFARSFPKVRVDVWCRPSNELLAHLAAGELDLCVATGDGADRVKQGGKMVSRMPLVWIGAKGLALETIWNKQDPLPLAVFHEGCLHRRWALEALDKADIPFRIAFGSMSLGAILAAVRSGLLVSVVARSSVDQGCAALGPESGLPPLPSVTVTLHVNEDPKRPAVACLAQFVEAGFAEPVPSN